MDMGKDSDVMSGIEPLESSSTATSALLEASPAGSNSKLSISFGSYHSSLQSSPKNPEQFKHRESPGRGELGVISPLYHRQQTSHPMSSTLMEPPPLPPVSSSHGNQRAATHSHTTTNFNSMPNTPFTQASLPEESKRLMVSADEVMLRERSVNPLHQQNIASSEHTKRELFSQTTQDYKYSGSLYRAPYTTAYTAASRSYKPYEPMSSDDKMVVTYSRDEAKTVQHGDHFDPTPRNNDVDSSVKKYDFPSTDMRSRNYGDKSDPYKTSQHQEIAEMEKVRESLHQMLNTSSRNQDSSSRSTPTELLAGALPPQDNSMDSVKTDTLLSSRPYTSDVSPLNVDSGFGLNAFKSFATNMSHDATESAAAKDPTLDAENHMLRDSLEKERYRRKHCEKQIAELQGKLLETQQQLAVAISTDKKKDAMIEQLDKTLARLVEGWKKQDQDKVDALKQLKEEKETTEKKLQELQKVYSKQTSEVNEVKNMLGEIERQNRQAIEEYKTQVGDLEQERMSLTEQLQLEQRKVQELHAQHESVMDRSQRLQRELRQTQQNLLQEKEQQQTQEDTLNDQMKSFEKEQMEALNKEKFRAEEQTQKAHEACELLTTVQRDVEKLKEQLESAIREKENAQLELNLQQARFEAGQRKQEAELHEDLEKTMNKHMTEYQEKAQKSETELQESHRAQIMDLQDQHQKEVEELRTVHQQEIVQREKRLETLRQQYQERLDENQEELARITNKTEDVQREKTILVGKLQDVLQAYYSGTLTDSESHTVSPTTQQSQTSSPVSKPTHVTPYQPTNITDAHLPRSKQNVPTNHSTVFGSGSGAGTLTASQIASLHTTVQLQQKQHHHTQHPPPHHHHGSSSSHHQQQTSHRTARSHQPPAAVTTLHKSPGALSEHEISHFSRSNVLEEASFLQSPVHDNSRMYHSRTLNTMQNPTRERGAGVERLRHQTEVHGGKGRHGHERQDEIPRLEQDPDRSFEGDSFVDARGYTSGEFFPLKAVTRSPTGSVVSTGMSDLSNAPMYETRSNAMLLEKLAEHEQRQMALQHYIKMLLNRSPGEEGSSQAVDTSAMMKERLPVYKDNPTASRMYDQMPVLDHKTMQQQPIKSAPQSRHGDTHHRHMHNPAERLQSKGTQGSRVATSSKQITHSASGKVKPETPSQCSHQPSIHNRSSASKPTKPFVVSKVLASRPSGKSTGRVSRIQASHGNDKRAGSEGVVKKRGMRGKEHR